jgi:hypothetical protein
MSDHLWAAFGNRPAMGDRTAPRELIRIKDGKAEKFAKYLVLT